MGKTKTSTKDVDDQIKDLMTQRRFQQEALSKIKASVEKKQPAVRRAIEVKKRTH